MAKTRKALSYSVFYEQAREGGYVAFVPALEEGRSFQGRVIVPVSVPA